jgi:hypothetical protein
VVEQQRPCDPQPPGRHPVPPGRQATVEAFRVEAAAPSYWRITALDAFDGQIGRPQVTTSVEGRLPSTPDPVPGPLGSARRSTSAPSTRSGSPPRSSRSPSTALTRRLGRRLSARGGCGSRDPDGLDYSVCRSSLASRPDAHDRHRGLDLARSPACPRPPARSPAASRRGGEHGDRRHGQAWRCRTGSAPTSGTASTSGPVRHRRPAGH